MNRVDPEFHQNCEFAWSMLLLINDCAQPGRKTPTDSQKIQQRLNDHIEHAMPRVRDICRSVIEFQEEEIRPEAEEVEAYPTTKAFPTEARMKQKAKEKLHKELTGEKHQPKKKPKKIQFGDDDCGENFSSIDDAIGNSEAFTIFDHLRKP